MRHNDFLDVPLKRFRFRINRLTAPPSQHLHKLVGENTRALPAVMQVHTCCFTYHRATHVQDAVVHGNLFDHNAPLTTVW